MQKTQDLNVTRIIPLPTPGQLRKDLPITDEMRSFVVKSRSAIIDILKKNDPRLLVFAGPCSIHNAGEALEYGSRLLKLSGELSGSLFIVMRTYFEKPRTTLGWKGLINDPHMDGSSDIPHGLRAAREIAVNLVSSGIPICMEALDKQTIRYLSDLLSWVCIGARTVTSPAHREMASGLSMPVGFKNGTDGSVQDAIDAIETSRHSHSFIGINDDGLISLVRTSGNPNCHVVLRGGRRGPNFQKENVADFIEKLKKEDVCTSIVIDCSHGNSQKDYRKQEQVLADVVAQRKEGTSEIVGVMLESYISDGKQQIPTDLSQLKPDISITDGCIGWEKTEQILRETAKKL